MLVTSVHPPLNVLDISFLKKYRTSSEWKRAEKKEGKLVTLVFFPGQFLAFPLLSELRPATGCRGYKEVLTRWSPDWARQRGIPIRWTSLLNGKVFKACVFSTLIYALKSYATYARLENRLLDITRRDKVTKAPVLEQTESLNVHLILCQHRLPCLGHLHLMKDGQIPKGIVICERATIYTAGGDWNARIRLMLSHSKRRTDFEKSLLRDFSI